MVGRKDFTEEQLKKLTTPVTKEELESPLFPAIGAKRGRFAFQLFGDKPVEQGDVGQIALMLGVEQIAQDRAARLHIGCDADENSARVVRQVE